MSASPLDSASNCDSTPKSASKKRKIRKGTTSCWECKNRKTRCDWSSESISICIFCQRRALPCTSQELPNPLDSNPARTGYWNSREQLDAISNQAPEKRRANASQPSQEHRNKIVLPNGIVPTIRSLDHRNGIDTALPLIAFTEHSPSTFLHNALPRPDIVALIFDRGRYFSLPFHLRQQPGGKPSNSVFKSEQLVQISKLPKTTDHPVHFARKLIQLALSLQELDASEWTHTLLDQQAHVAARRFMNAASTYVTSRDSLVDSLDGLDTLILEACYRINSGQLHGAWLTIRRALAIAQLINVPRLADRPATREESV